MISMILFERALMKEFRMIHYLFLNKIRLVRLINN